MAGQARGLWLYEADRQSRAGLRGKPMWGLCRCQRATQSHVVRVVDPTVTCAAANLGGVNALIRAWACGDALALAPKVAGLFGFVALPLPFASCWLVGLALAFARFAFLR